ncbi:unnamed protein product [Boreogadus saida]
MDSSEENKEERRQGGEMRDRTMQASLLYGTDAVHMRPTHPTQNAVRELAWESKAPGAGDNQTLRPVEKRAQACLPACLSTLKALLKHSRGSWHSDPQHSGLVTQNGAEQHSI